MAVTGSKRKYPSTLSTMPRGRRILARCQNLPSSNGGKDLRTPLSVEAAQIANNTRPPTSSTRTENNNRSRTRSKRETKQDGLHRAKTRGDEHDASNQGARGKLPCNIPRKMSACEKKEARARAKRWSDDRKKNRAVNTNNNHSSTRSVKFSPMTEMIN